MLIETLLVFVLTSALCLIAGRALWCAPSVRMSRALRDLMSAGPRPRLKWDNVEAIVRFAAKMGGMFGGRNRKRGRQLQNAGFRSPRAESLYQGFQVIGAVLAALLFSAIARLANAQDSTIFASAATGLLAGFNAPAGVLRWRTLRRIRQIERALPNTLDLLTICVEAGLGLDQAIQYVGRDLRKAHPEMSEELATVILEMRAGRRRIEALRGLAERTGVDEIRKLTAILAQADRFGTSIAQSLRSHSAYLRTQMRLRAEEKAGKLSVKLVFPIFFFILPALFILSTGPVVMNIFTELIPLLNGM